VLAPAAPALLLVALRGLSPARALRVGFVAGWLAHAALLHWAYVVTVTYGHAPVVVGLLAPFGMSLYIVPFIAGFAWVAALLAQRGLANPFLLAAAWTTFEWLRSWVLTGFTWGGIGYAWHQSPLLGSAAYGGVYALTFGAALIGALAASPRRGARWAGGVSIALHLGWLGLLAYPHIVREYRYEIYGRARPNGGSRSPRSRETSTRAASGTPKRSRRRCSRTKTSRAALRRTARS
jgi:apolipoprotein N-acyltransferase